MNRDRSKIRTEAETRAQNSIFSTGAPFCLKRKMIGHIFTKQGLNSSVDANKTEPPEM